MALGLGIPCGKCGCAQEGPCYGGRRSLLITVQGFEPEHVGYGIAYGSHWLSRAAGWGRNPRTINGTYRLRIDDGAVCRWLACLPTPSRASAVSASVYDQQGFSIVLEAGGLPAITIDPESPVFYAQAESVSSNSLPQQFSLAGGDVVITLEADDGRSLPSETSTTIDGYAACGCPSASPYSYSASLDPSCVGGDGVVCYSSFSPSISDIELDLTVQGISTNIDSTASRRYSLRRNSTSGTLLLQESYDGNQDDGVGWSVQVPFNSATGTVATSTGDLVVYISITPMAGKPWESVYDPNYFGQGVPSWNRDKSSPTVCDGTKNRYAMQVEIEAGSSGVAFGQSFFTMAEFFTDECFDRLCNGVRAFSVERTHTHHWPPPNRPGEGLVLPSSTIQITVERP